VVKLCVDNRLCKGDWIKNGKGNEGKGVGKLCAESRLC